MSEWQERPRRVWEVSENLTHGSAGVMMPETSRKISLGGDGKERGVSP